MSTFERFMSHVEILDCGCWKWTASRYPNGYGRFIYLGKVGYAHRFSYEYHKGEIGVGLQIDHLCRNKWCVNPDHLEAVTLAENIRRFNENRTHCKRGHEFSRENTYIQRGNKRVCRACNSMHCKEYRDKLKAVQK